MNTERDTEIMKLHGAMNRAVAQLNIADEATLSEAITICLDAHNSTAALQKRIEELEAQASFVRNEALEQAASICDELSPHPDPHYDVNRAAAKIRTLKVGDVQAPKEVTFDECIASGAGHNWTNSGYKGALACEWCGKEAPKAVGNLLLQAAKYSVSALATHNAGGSIESADQLKRAQQELFNAIKDADPAYYGFAGPTDTECK